MAVVKVDTPRRRWMISPRDIMERSALLQVPSRKWMTQMNMFIIPFTQANARALQEQVAKKALNLYEGDRDTVEFIASLDNMLKSARTDRVWPTWYTFNNTKYPPAEHQIDALKRLYPVDSGGLFMEMGTMKTRVMIDWMSAAFYEQRIKFVIVAAPLTVKMSTWQDELANYSPCPYNFIDVDTDFKAHNLRVQQDRLTWLLVGIESLSQGRTLEALLPVTRLGIPYACGVDESTRIANWKAICTQSMYKLRKNAAMSFIATGFELKRDLEDLYSQMEFLDPNIIGVGDFIAFRNRYCIMGGYKNKQIVGYNNIEELMGLIAPHIYQCDKSKLNLPPKLYEKRMVELSPEQKKVYQKVKSGEIEKVSVENILTKTLRLQQVANGFYNTDRIQKDEETGKKVKAPVEFHEVVSPGKNPKLKELINIAKEISHPMIVWAETLYEVRIIEEALSKRGEVVKILGETPKEDRRAIVQRFQTGEVPYFVGTASAGGIGITLTAARTVVYFSNSQRLEYRIQSEDRAHRKGQTGSVTIIDLVAAGTVDVSILENHREKTELAMYIKAALRSRIAMERFFDGKVEYDILKALSDEAPIIARADMGMDA